MRYLSAADTGGTFTDFVGIAPDGRKLLYSKSLTTYDDPMRGVLDGVAKAGVTVPEMDTFKLGTTLVINALLQRKGAVTALVATRGFRDTLEIGRGNRPIPFDVSYRRDPVLVPRDRRFEVRERIGARGEIIEPLSEADVEAVAAEIAALGVEAVAVAFLNAYANSAHEDRAVAALRGRLHGVYVTGSAELTREWYEYERTSTAAANAYVGPLLQRYVDRVRAGLAEGGFRANSYIMSSAGGVFSLEEAERQPVQLVESGPVGGCIGAAAYARRLGYNRLIAFDMGGTTAKCAVIENGQFETRSPYFVGGETFGFPIRGSVVDILEVGAGGGSIAAVDEVGRLAVGPQSAGSTPGPACYGLGGEEPTMTDANVLLGRINPGSFLGGELSIDADAARRAVWSRVAEPLGYSLADLDRVCQGIVDLGAMTMSSAIEQITVERGLDPREFVLFVFGGGGPLHGGALARQIGIPLVIVPPCPGVFSAVGMLMSDARAIEARTFLRPLADAALSEITGAFAEMEKIARSRLPSGSGAGGESRVLRHAELRYKGQRHAMKTDVGGARDAAAIRAAFEAAYGARYGHADALAPVEIVALSVTVVAPADSVNPDLLTPTFADAGMASPTLRSVYFGEIGARRDTMIYQRTDLAIGSVLQGPAIVEEYGSSTVVGPQDRVEVGELGELLLWVNGHD